MKIVTYNWSNFAIVNYIMAFKHPNVVKVTISKCCDSITTLIRKNAMSVAHCLSRDGQIYSMHEGVFVNNIHIENTFENVKIAITAIDKFLETAKGQYEIILSLNEQNKFGIILMDYVHPSNWSN